MIFPALVDASADDRLRGEPLRIYLWLLCHRLDLQEYRSLKIEGVAVSLRVKRHTAIRALRLLAAGGYVERRHAGRDGYVYRLRWRRAEGDAAA